VKSMPIAARVQIVSQSEFGSGTPASVMQLYKAWYSVIHWCWLEGARANPNSSEARQK